MHATPSSDVLVVGGGVIGLSIAFQLASDGLSVTLLERDQTGRAASWAGAGVLPPASWYVDDPAVEALCLAAASRHGAWSDRLREVTGLDDEYWPCGAEYLRTEANAEHVERVLARWAARGVAVQDGAFVPAEAQVRNPRRLKALVAACRAAGVRVLEQTEVVGIDRDRSDSIGAVLTRDGRHTAAAYCFAAGCWTPRLASQAGSEAPGRPVRGQMLLLRPARPVIDRIVHCYPHYAVPRRDGRVLVGATVEEVGFQRETTQAARLDLMAAARRIAPALGDAPIEAQWSGLRPASADTVPTIGPLPGVANAWVASGHHRSGLQLAPPTAEIISAMIRGVPCDLPFDSFAPARFAGASLRCG